MKWNKIQLQVFPRNTTAQCSLPAGTIVIFRLLRSKGLSMRVPCMSSHLEATNDSKAKNDEVNEITCLQTRRSRAVIFCLDWTPTHPTWPDWRYQKPSSPKSLGAMEECWVPKVASSFHFVLLISQLRTRIIALCGVNDWHDNASPQEDGRFLSDFYLFHHLLEETGKGYDCRPC